MKRQVMQPFRARRKQNEKSSHIRQSPRRQGKQDQEVDVVPYKKGIRMTSYRDAIEMAKHGVKTTPIQYRGTEHTRH
jgi:hypothetical protein